MIAIVEYSPAHAHAVSSIFVSTFVGEGYSPATFAGELRPGAFTARGSVLVALEADLVLGAVVLVLPSSRHRQIATEDEAELHLLAVDNRVRGRGVGAALIASVVDRASSLGFSRLILSTQRTQMAAHSVYERSGFARVPERDWPRPAGGEYLVFSLEL